MIKKGKLACDWCGKVFNKRSNPIVYGDNSAYHTKCAEQYLIKGDTEIVYGD